MKRTLTSQLWRSNPARSEWDGQQNERGVEARGGILLQLTLSLSSLFSSSPSPLLSFPDLYELGSSGGSGWGIALLAWPGTGKWIEFETSVSSGCDGTLLQSLPLSKVRELVVASAQLFTSSPR